MTAANRTTVALSSLPPGSKVVIQRVSLRHVGLDAGMALLEHLDFGRIAAQNAQEGGQLVAQVATTPPRPPESPREPNTPVPPGLRREIGLMVDRAVVMAGVVSPSFEELCALYGADQGEPEKAFGPDWDVLVRAISTFSIDPAVGHIGTGGSPALSETFPDALGPNAR